jgi:dCMP deaminase
MIGMIERPNEDDHYMELASVVAKRSTCLRNWVGAVLVNDRHIIATGYNGSPKGFPHCRDSICLRRDVPSGKEPERCLAIHAEQNAIIQSALHGASPKGSTIYCTHQPCTICAKMLINAGIVRVVYKYEYPDMLGLQLLEQAGIEIKKVEI